MKKIRERKELTLFLCFLFIFSILYIGLSKNVYAQSNNVFINEKNFPDSNFREYISENFDLDDDNILSQEEIDEVSYIALYELGIKDVTGIKYFTELESFYCEKNPLKFLDLSGFKKLNNINCNSNRITKLKLNDLPNLFFIDCYSNQLTELDLSGLDKLVTLDCSDNEISELNLSGRSKLEFLDCSNNNLEKLNLNGNTNLKLLFCYYNQLSTLDLSGLTNLERAQCYSNQLKKLNLNGLANLKYLLCDNNQLEELNLNELTKLENLECSKNKIKNLNLSNLIFLYCPDNQLENIDLGSLNNLKTINCDNNQLVEIDLNGIINLEDFSCNNNKIEKLNLENNNVLKYFDCSNNRIKELNLKNLTKLEQLSCKNNMISSIDVIENTKITKLYTNPQRIEVYRNTKNNYYEIDLSSLSIIDKSRISLNPNKKGYKYDQDKEIIQIDKNLGVIGSIEYIYSFPRETITNNIIPIDDLIVSIDWSVPELLKEDGWKKGDNKWYYYKDNKKIVDKWIWAPIDLNQDGKVDLHNWKYFNKEGISQTTFYIDNKTVWLSQSGPYNEYLKGWWENEAGMKYYFRESSGSRVEGFQFIDGYWRFFRKSGTMVTGWQFIDGGWKYFRNDGSLVIDKWIWLPIDTNKDGIYDSNSWKYFDKKGNNITTFYIDGENVWLSQAGPNEEYLKGWWENEAGMRYFFRKTSGSRVHGWQFIDGAWRFFRNSGTMVTGRQWIDGELKIFDKNGKLIGNR